MPKTKRLLKKRRPTVKTLATTVGESESQETCDVCDGKRKPLGPILAVTLFVILFIVLAINKGYVLAALVNGMPVFRWQLTSTLLARYGKTTLEGIISEKLIADEAKKKNISLTQQEIDKKEEEILKSFGGGVTLDEVLKFQGMTKAEFDKQVSVQLMVTKLLGGNITVEDTEVTAFIEKNRSFLTATDEADLREEAKNTLFDQKINEKIQPWFTEVKNKAKILRFL